MSRKQQKKTFRVVRLFAVAVLLMAGYLVFEIKRAPVSQPAESSALPGQEEILYEVPRNIGVSALAADLAAKGLIGNARIFSLYLRVTRMDKKIRAGYYFLPPANSIFELAKQLTTGRMATKTITIPEGKASWEIYSILKGHYKLDSLRFDSLVQSGDFASTLGANARGLEGYLFPDTYVLPWDLTEEEVLKILYQRFRAVLAELDTSAAPFVKHGLHGFVTLASIVEKEAAVKSEQRLIAGVFLNRLEKGWSLGADPTVRFALRKLTGPLYVSELGSNSAYNTRKFAGLPPGPICSPGKEALLATLNPLETDMMYFVAKDDGTREHFFSKDGSQHNRFKSEAARNRKIRGQE